MISMMIFLFSMSNVVPFQRFKDATNMTIIQTAIWVRENGWKNLKVRFIPGNAGFRVQLERLPLGDSL